MAKSIKKAAKTTSKKAMKQAAKKIATKNAKPSAKAKTTARATRSSATLFTIGYEQSPQGAVLDALQAAGVKLLIDVRAVAASRRPGFSKSQLAAGLDTRGISYLHLRGLGTPKEGREAARSGDAQALERIYAAHLKTPQAREEMDELSSLMTTTGPICLLCYEIDHKQCHRRFIAEIIEDRHGVAVSNLVPRAE